MKRRHWVSLAVTVCLAAIALPGCNRSQPSADASSVKVGLGAWMLMEYPMLSDVVRNFEGRHPGTKIEYVKFGDEVPNFIMQFRRKYSDNDLIFGTSDGIDMYSAVRLGALTDLSAKVSDTAWTSLIAPAQAEAARYGGGKVCVPFFGEVMAINYNKALLNQAGFTAPATTWDELEAQAVEIHQKLPNKIPIAVRLYEYADIYWTIPTLLSIAGTTEDQDGWPMTDGFAMEQSLTMLRRWVEKGLCNSVDVRPADVFRSGDAVYFISWASHGSWARKTLGDDAVQVVPLPGERAYVSFHFGTVPVFGANAELAAKFLEEEILSDTMQKGAFASGKMGVRAADYAKGDIPQWIMPLRAVMEHGYTGPSVKRNVRELNLRIHEAVQSVATGKLTPADAMKRMTTAKEEIKAKVEAAPEQ